MPACASGLSTRVYLSRSEFETGDYADEVLAAPFLAVHGGDLEFPHGVVVVRRAAARGAAFIASYCPSSPPGRRQRRDPVIHFQKPWTPDYRASPR
jgi:hypothetical protein